MKPIDITEIDPLKVDALIKLTVRRSVGEQAQLYVGIDQVSDNDDLYENGMTPFGAIRVMLVLEEAFENCEFPISMLNRGTFATMESIGASLAKILNVAPSAPEWDAKPAIEKPILRGVQ